MKHLKLFEQKKYSKFLYLSSIIEKLLPKKWINIHILRNEIHFDIENDTNEYTYKVYFESLGAVHNISVQDNIKEKFCEKLNQSFTEKDIMNVKKNIMCLNNIEKYKKTSTFNI